MKLRRSSSTVLLCLLSSWCVYGAEELSVNHADCTFFGRERERASKRESFRASLLTKEVVRRLPFAAQARKSESDLAGLGTIDSHLFQAMENAGVAPAAKTNDFEFIRRASLDLTGRVPDAGRLLQFVSDSASSKREQLVEELQASEAWLDKWTMFFGDLFKNTVNTPAVTRYPEGRDAFHKWIRESLATNKPYNQMATELIATDGTNSFSQGEVNWLVGGLVMGSPRSGQDHFDQQAANVAETFLGISHMNCVLCHDGGGHLDSLSLWGKKAARIQAWELSSFFSRTFIGNTPVPETNRRYYFLEDGSRYNNDYPLNTQTGNRPPREPIGRVANIAPKYPFSGRGPEPGENYRLALARELTGDLQFARAIVNYLWKEFFFIGLVEPVNQFDPARLDPNNPPPEPWKLQPSNARLLNALAQEFVDGGFDLKMLMRRIVNSESYQLSSRYEGEWRPEWETLYARKLVRRLWAEEIHDAVAQTSGILPVYRIGAFATNWAMQFPETLNMPGRNATSALLDSFTRGDRDQTERRSDGSPLQALNLMNHEFVVSRCRIVNSGGVTSLAAKFLDFQDSSLVEALFLTILSRYPTSEEKAAAISTLQSGSRRQAVENLQWALYNKVDFIFNY